MLPSSRSPAPSRPSRSSGRFSARRRAETTRGSDCTTTTSLNAILPGAVLEIKRTIWEMGQVTVRDAGPNGTGYAACPPTCGDGDETTFMRQGIFVP